jgi:hypothetical protein
MATRETVKPRKARNQISGAKGVDISVRFPSEAVAAINAFIANQPGPISRPEAIRLLVKRGLFEGEPPGQAPQPPTNFPGAVSSLPSGAGKARR